VKIGQRSLNIPAISAVACLLIFQLVDFADARADQLDPRLDALFMQLQNASDPSVAKRAEQEIWTIWHETPDSRSMEIMITAREALDMNDVATAIGLLDDLVAHAPDFAEAWNQRAIVLYLADDFAGSLRDIDRTLALEPRHFGALSGRGQIFLRLDEYELALSAFQAALDQNPWMDNIRNQMEMIRALLNERQKPI
jgi:tetratricopeptide (TPR) repeat protein